MGFRRVPDRPTASAGGGSWMPVGHRRRSRSADFFASQYLRAARSSAVWPPCARGRRAKDLRSRRLRLAGYSAWDVLAPLAVTFERIYVGLVAAYSAGSSSLADRCARAAWATERCDEALATSKGTMSASSNSRPRESNGVVLIALSQRTDSWSSSSRRLQTRVDQPVSQTDVADSPAERGQQEIAPFPAFFDGASGNRLIGKELRRSSVGFVIFGAGQDNVFTGNRATQRGVGFAVWNDPWCPGKPLQKPTWQLRSQGPRSEDSTSGQAPRPHGRLFGMRTLALWCGSL